MRDAEQKSPGSAGSKALPYATTGTARCMAAETSTKKKRSVRFIPIHSSSRRILRPGQSPGGVLISAIDRYVMLRSTMEFALTHHGQRGSIGLTT